MKVFPEITEIAEHIEAANNLIANIEKTHGEICEGVDWSSARFTKLSEEDISLRKTSVSLNSMAEKLMSTT